MHGRNLGGQISNLRSQNYLKSQISDPKSNLHEPDAFNPPAFGYTFTLSIRISASLALPNRPGAPTTLGVASAASMVHSPGSLSSRFHSLPCSSAEPSLFSARNLIVYQASG